MNARYLMLALVLALAGCGSEDHDDLKQWMKQESDGMKGSVKEPPPLVTPPIVSYSSMDKESPFSMDKVRTKELQGNDPTDPTRSHTPEYLEGFPLESLRLIGVIGYKDQMFALIQTPEKPKHVTVGNYMGPNFGKVTAINKNEIRIAETVKDANDIWVKREKVLYLQQDGGERK